MYKYIAALLLSAVAYSFPALAWGEEGVDAPITTAPPENEAMVVPQQVELDLLLPAVPPELRPPRLHEKPHRSSCAGTLGLDFQKGYFDPNHGLDVADGKATSQARVSGTCDDVTAEVAGSVLLSSKEEKYGSEKLANEWSVKFTYHPELETFVGTFRLELAASYRGFANSQGLFATRDDSTELVAGVGYVLSFGPFEFVPYARATKSNPVGYNNSLYWIGEGLKVTGPLPGDSAFHMDCINLHNVNSYTAVIHRNVTYCSFEGTKVLPGKGLMFTAGVWFSLYGKQDLQYDLLVERDGRMRRIPEQDRSSDKLMANPYFGFAYRF